MYRANPYIEEAVTDTGSEGRVVEPSLCVCVCRMYYFELALDM